MPDEHAFILEQLHAAVRRRYGVDGGVSRAELLSGGASAQTWALEVSGKELPERLILRRSHPGKQVGLSKETEARIQQAAFAAGVPTPEVFFALDDDDGLGDGYVMGAVEGETIARRILRDDQYADARPVMAGQCGTILAKVHAIDPAPFGELRCESPRQQLESLRLRFDKFTQQLPVFEVAFRWLLDHLPAQREPALLHGDFRNGNFIVGPDGIRAVIDWELAHLGDPMEDLGWLCVNSWRFGLIDQPVGGFGDRETLFAAYEAAGGGKIDPAVVRFWEVFGTLHWGVICLVQAHTHLSGGKRSVEHATIGRRVSETEIDLLQLIDPSDQLSPESQA